MYADVHAHLNDPRIASDIDKIIENAKLAGINSIINNGTNYKTNLETLSLAKKYSIIRAALGVYPSEINEDIEKNIKLIKENSSSIAAIGEVGLDKTYPDFEKQQEVFSQMISLAIELNKPISVHTRAAEEQVILQLEREGAKKVHLHCFMGSIELVKKAAKLGYYFSVPCTIMRLAQFEEMVKIVPIPQLLTETDSPYLSAAKGVRNEPANIPSVVKKIAEIKSLEEQEARNLLFMNYQKLFC